MDLRQKAPTGLEKVKEAARCPRLARNRPEPEVALTGDGAKFPNASVPESQPLAFSCRRYTVSNRILYPCPETFRRGSRPTLETN